MIRNLVFDFGQVLIRFVPRDMAAPYAKTEEERDLLARVVFDRAYWDKLDAGTITDEEVIAAVREALPEGSRDAGERCYRDWIYHIPEIDGMRELLCRKKKEGYRIFILSNISRYFAAHAGEIPILAEAERCVFSAVCGHLKPHADMFAYLCDTCGIRKEETVFIDDNPQNVAGAEAFGIRSILFTGSAAALDKALASLLEK